MIYFCYSIIIINVFFIKFTLFAIWITPTVSIPKKFLLCPVVGIIKLIVCSTIKNVKNVLNTNCTCCKLCKLYIRILVAFKPSLDFCRIRIGSNLKIAIMTIILITLISFRLFVNCGVITIHTDTIGHRVTKRYVVKFCFCVVIFVIGVSKYVERRSKCTNEHHESQKQHKCSLHIHKKNSFPAQEPPLVPQIK